MASILHSHLIFYVTTEVCQYWNCLRHSRNSRTCGAGLMSWHGGHGTWVWLLGLQEAWGWGEVACPHSKRTPEFSAPNSADLVFLSVWSLLRLVMKQWSWDVDVLVIVECGCSCQDFSRLGAWAAPLLRQSRIFTCETSVPIHFWRLTCISFKNKTSLQSWSIGKLAAWWQLWEVGSFTFITIRLFCVV